MFLLLKRISQVIVFIIFISCNLKAAPFEAYKPTWKIGQKWQVEVAVKTQAKSTREDKLHFVPRWVTLNYDFVVEKVVKIDGEPCWCIRLGFLKSNEPLMSSKPYCRMYYRVSDGTLKRLESLSWREPNKVIAGDTYSGGTAIVGIWTRPIPMAFPFFLADSAKYSPTPYIRGDGTKRYNFYEAYQSISIIKEGELKIYIKERDEKKEQEGLASSQIWEKGMPWWTEAIDLENGVFQSKARLVSINGKKLKNPRPWNLGPANKKPVLHKK